MYIERVPNRNSRPAVLLRESFREGGKVRKRTLANLTGWPEQRIEALRAVLKGETQGNASWRPSAGVPGRAQSTARTRSGSAGKPAQDRSGSGLGVSAMR
jgi:hypothetical protein